MNSNNNENVKTRLPYSTAVLVLGISSITFFCCYGIPGIATGIIALILYKKDLAIYNKNKEKYDNFENLKTGKTLSIIGLIMSGIYLIYLLVAITIYGMDAISNPTILIQGLDK